MELNINGGKALVERITALDRSTAPEADQLQEAWDLIGLKAPDHDQLPSIVSSYDRYISDYNPKDEWVLRWLLKRLGSSSGVDQFCDRYEAWFLLALLVGRLPVKSLARLLHGTVLLTNILNTIQRQRTALASTISDVRGGPGNSEWQSQMANFPRGKRDAEKSIACSIDTRLDSGYAESHLFSIAFALTALQAKISQNSVGPGALAAQHVSIALQGTSETAAKALGSCVWVTLHLLREGTHSTIDESEKFESIVEPFLVVWQSRKHLEEGNVALIEGRLLAQFCVIPLSRLWQLLPDNIRAQNIIEALITEGCFAAYTDQAVNASRGSSTGSRRSLENATNLARDCFLDMSTKDAVESTNEPRSFTEGSRASIKVDSRAAAPTMLELLLKMTFGEKRKLDSARILWIQNIFHAFSKTVGLDLAELSSSTITTPALQCLTEMLLVALRFNFPLGVPTLKTVMLQFCDLKEERVGDDPWQRLRLCININHRVLTDNMLKSETDNQDLPRLLFDAVSEGVEEQDDREPGEEARNTARLLLVESIIDAFIKDRNLPSFLDLWQQQIAKQLEQMSRPDQHLPGVVIWESVDVFKGASQRLRAKLTPQQRTKMFEERKSSLFSNAETKTEEQYAALLVSSCIIEAMSTSKVSELSSEAAAEFLEALVTALLDSSFPKRLKQGLWRFLTILLGVQPKCATGTLGLRHLQGLTTLASETVLDTLKRGCDVVEYENAYTALTFLTESGCLVAKLDHTVDTFFQQSLEAIVGTLNELLKNWLEGYTPLRADGILPSSAYASWRPFMFSIASPAELAIACCYSITMNAIVLRNIKPSLGHTLISQIHSLASHISHLHQQASNRDINSRYGISWYSLWKLFRSSQASDEDPRIIKMVREAQLCLLLQSEDETVWRPAFTATSDIPYNYALQEANFIHFEGLTKSERTYLANSLTQKIKEWFFSEDFHWQNLLSLLLRLMSNPNKMMHLIKDPALALERFSRLDGIPIKTHDGIFLLQALFRAILRHLSQDAIAPDTAVSLKIFAKITNKRIELLRAQRPLIPSSIVIAVMINALGHGGSETPHLHPFAILWFVESQHKYFSKPLCYDSESYAAILANLAEVGHLIDRETWVRVYGQVGTHDDLTNCGKAMKDCFRQVIKNMTAEMDAKVREVPHDPSRLAEIADAPALARASVADILSHFAHTIQSPDWLLKFKGTELSYFKSSSRLHSRIVKLKREFLLLTTDEKVDVLSQLRNDLRDLDISQLRLWKSSIGHPIAVEERTVPIKSVLAAAFTSLYSSVLEETRLPHGAAKLSILVTILSKNPWSITQEHIDSSMALVTILTSSKSPFLPDKEALVKKTLMLLVSLLRTIFTTHRLKIGGRFHLLVAALRGLLRSLYKPYQNTREHELQQAGWIKAAFASPKPLSTPTPTASSSTAPTFSTTVPHPQQPQHLKLDVPGAEEAAALSRLLTLLTEPSPSILKPPKKKRQPLPLEQEQEQPKHPQLTGPPPPLLNDPTKKARALAGQHLQYLVMEYCVCQLKGRLDAGVQRALLEPGLYSVLGAMGKGIRQLVGDALAAREPGDNKDRGWGSTGVGKRRTDGETSEGEQAREVYRALVAGWRRYEGR